MEVQNGCIAMLNDDVQKFAGPEKDYCATASALAEFTLSV
jgi:hypothetical protein